MMMGRSQRPRDIAAENLRYEEQNCRDTAAQKLGVNDKADLALVLTSDV